MENQFQIIYTGKFNSQLDIRNTSAQLALIINSTPEHALAILQSRQEAILFDQVELTKSLNLISNLEQIGLVVISVEKSTNLNNNLSNRVANDKLIKPIKKLSNAYKKFILYYTVISTVILISFLIYLFLSN